MTITIPPCSPNQTAGMRQFVLFPEQVGVFSVPLEQPQDEQRPAQAEEQEERRFSLKEALAAGQTLLW